MEEAITEIRRHFKKSRAFLNNLRYLTISEEQPSWMSIYDPLYEVIKKQAFLIRNGSVHWAAVVQANCMLFSPGKNNCPAHLIYCPGNELDASLDELRALASEVYQLKNTTPEDPEKRKIADMLTDEFERGMGWYLPTQLSDIPVKSTAFMVFRRHLPNRMLTASIFPILAHPSTEATLMVPCMYWPASLKEKWVHHDLG
ncbi:hypothetical protein [Paludibacterium purpuratum]|uniref:Uncharacterized protein n=1 Tax=Paludibacterium purpuratum TaxID=1144873 RepID=A0A4R7B331_9NEIS|nr:hypothetical protein [Paludibacterium purpuratum]TDR76430.1 hypothetical protein DFP86_11113 [Paludibacterium purpuratum]